MGGWTRKVRKRKEGRGGESEVGGGKAAEVEKAGRGEGGR